MRYVSTRGNAPNLDFADAILAGLASDGGLYLPESWPQIAPAEIAGFATTPYAGIAQRVIAPLIGDALPEDELRAI
ncbi:MAG: threonine synthase, partial [Cucumibacter sp.]